MLSDEFEALAATLRPDLHRYCARMVGSGFDGEDVVQEALAKAAEAYPLAGEIAQPRAWLFRIAHNAALDALRRRKREEARRSQADLDAIVDEGAVADARVAVSASLAAFMPLSATERSSVILTDVLGDSLEETAQVLGVSLAAVKAALHRGRARLKSVAAASTAAASVTEAEKARLRHYVDRFNARDFDALRDLLAEDVKLDLVNRVKLAGRKDVAIYFHRYEEISDWRFQAVLAEGRLALLGFDQAPSALRWLVLLDWRDGRITQIQDFKYAAYVTEAVSLSVL